MFKSDNSQSKFPEYAEGAASLERMGKFNNAAFAWAGAAYHAQNPENRAWAEARCEFCSYKQSKEAV